MKMSRQILILFLVCIYNFLLIYAIDDVDSVEPIHVKETVQQFSNVLAHALGMLQIIIYVLQVIMLFKALLSFRGGDYTGALLLFSLTIGGQSLMRYSYFEKTYTGILPSFIAAAGVKNPIIVFYPGYK